MSQPPNLGVTLIDAWRTNSRVTAYLVEHLPAALWEAAVPGAPRRTICMIAGHLHNARCMWIKTLGQEHGRRILAGGCRKSLPRTGERRARAVQRLTDAGSVRGRRPGPPSKCVAQPAAGCPPTFSPIWSRMGPSPRPDRHAGASTPATGSPVTFRDLALALDKQRDEGTRSAVSGLSRSNLSRFGPALRLLG
jgi:hypothetical protein